MTSVIERLHRNAIVFGTLAALAWTAYGFVSVASQLGARFGTRSAVAIAMPLLAGGYAFSRGSGVLRRIRDLPAAVRFCASLVAGGLVMASVRAFLQLYPILVAELWVASCIAVLVFASGAIPLFALDRPDAVPARPLALFWGMAAGMLFYVVVFGVPRIVPG